MSHITTPERLTRWFQAWRTRRRQRRYLRNRVVFIGCGPRPDPRDWLGEFHRSIKP